MNLPTILVAFVILTLLMSFFYLYIFSHENRGLFIRFWGLSWIFYSVSLFLLTLYLNHPLTVYLGLRKLFDMLNITFLLFGAYSFIYIPIPSYWNRFSLYMVLWAVIGIYYHFDTLSIFLPINFYQTIVTITLCYLILKHWTVPRVEKYISMVVFLLWGTGKAALSVIEVGADFASSLYMTEIIFSNILNFSIFIIYLERARSQIAFADRLYRIIAENATDVIFYYSLKPQRAFTYITPSVEEMTGYSPADFYSDPSFYLHIVPASQIAEISMIFQPDDQAHDPYTRSFEIIHKNGSALWSEFNVSAFYENGEPVAVEGIIRDITAMKNAESELIASRQSRDLLLSYISHELRTPVTSIIGYINAIKDGTIDNSQETNSALDIIFSKALTLEHLINDLFQLSKLETNQFSFSFMIMEAEELSRILINNHAMDIRTAGIKLEYRINCKALKDVYIIADPERINQVFSNIITNAIKHCGPKDKITVKFDLDAQKENFTVSVSDSGEGIRPDDIPNIFDRFYTGGLTINGTRNSSTGLGLTISREIITAHHGTISAKSRAKKGSTFIFTIPIYTD